jgi:DNA polymerase III subunit delta'
MAFAPDEAYRLLEKAHHEGRLAHAYLISGSRREDLMALAVRLVNLVNGWAETDLQGISLRGVPVLEPESKMRQIKIGAMRDLEKRFHVSSDHAWKVGIILDADRQTPQAANCFLKTLEEPPPNSLILELTTNPESMLDTVLSRCIRVPLFQPGRYVMELTPAQENVVAAVGRHFQGNLNAARAMGLLQAFQAELTIIKDQVAKLNKAAYKAEVEEYGQTTDGSWLKDREDYYEDVAESEYKAARTSLLGVLDAWLGETLKQKAGAGTCYLPQQAEIMRAVCYKMSFADLQRRLRAIDELRSLLLGTTVREPLAMEVAFLKAFS